MKTEINLNDNKEVNKAVPKKLLSKSSSFVPANLDKKKVNLEDKTGGSTTEINIPQKNTDIYCLIDKIPESEESNNSLRILLELSDVQRREDLFKQLINQRDKDCQLSVFLWFTPGIVAILLQEIISVYPHITNMSLSHTLSDRICHVLGLFQCIALDHRTRPCFLRSNLHLYVYPLINTLNKQRPYEHLRVTSLGVIGALVKGDECTEAIRYLMKTELIVLCLRIMKKGYEMSRTVSVFIVLKILQDNIGLDYVCRTEERLNAVAGILKDMVDEVDKSKSDEMNESKIIRQALRCFNRLSENQKFFKKSK